MSAAIAFIEALLLVVFRAVIYCILAFAANGFIILLAVAFGAEKEIPSVRIGIVALIGFFVYAFFFFCTIVSYYRPFYWPVREDERSFMRVVARTPVTIFLWFSGKLDRPNAEFYYTLYLFFSASCWFAVTLLLAANLGRDPIASSVVVASLYDALLYTIDLFLKGTLLDFSEHFQLEIHSKVGEQSNLSFLIFTFSYRTLAGLIGLGAILKIVDLMKTEISRL